MRAQTPAIDVIIVNHHGAHALIDRLAGLELGAADTLQVVDNSVESAQAALLHKALAGQRQARLHVTAANLGFAGGCNLAFDRCASPFVLLLNPDVRLQPGALERLRSTLHASPRLAALAPRIDWTAEGGLVMPNLSAQSPAFRIEQALASRWARWWPRAFGRRGTAFARKTMQVINASAPVPARLLSGAALLLRRDAALAAWHADCGGGSPTLFDAGFFMYFEDTDLSLRLRQAGWALAVEPRARAWHAWHDSHVKAELMAQAERRFLQRHHRWTDALQRWLVPRLHCDPWRGDAAPVPRLTSADAARQLGPVWAMTPLPMLHPAAVRAGNEPLPISGEEWALMRGGRWHLLLARGPKLRDARWQRVDAAAA